MNIPADELTQSIYNKSFQECSVDELQDLVQQYPYFGPAHLLLTLKLKLQNSASYDEDIQGTSLYFSNPLWLQYLLNDDGGTNTAVENFEIKFSATEDGAPVAVEAGEETTNETTDSPESLVETQTQDDDVAPITIAEQSTEEPMKANLLLDISSLKIEPSDKGLLFEPYHTVDYFASQGIKYKEDEKPKDRFSVQLRSFTEWLKTMKKVPVNELIDKSDPGNEKKVEQMAEYSLAERHVITEAMAEVWKKQGNKAKAEDIYNKLSLLDPSKSSYFAAKIEELKKTS